MESLKQIVKIPENRKISIELPRDIPTGETEVMIIISPVGKRRKSFGDKILQMKKAVNDSAFVSDVREI